MVPNKTLELTIEPKKMTIGEAALFANEDFDFRVFINFLVKNSNWTKAEIQDIQIDELEALAKSVGEAIQNTTPLPKS